MVVLTLVRLGITTPRGLRRNRRYAILASSAISAALPGGDPVSMLLLMIPLMLLYELRLLAASISIRRWPLEAAGAASA